jgi:hypothetical protein
VLRQKQFALRSHGALRASSSYIPSSYCVSYLSSIAPEASLLLPRRALGHPILESWIPLRIHGTLASYRLLLYQAPMCEPQTQPFMASSQVVIVWYLKNYFVSHFHRHSIIMDSIS